MLRTGSSGDDVKELQQRLQAAGYDPGPIDGAFGPKTDAAVRALQKASGADVDGVVGPQTLAKLIDAVSAAVRQDEGEATPRFAQEPAADDTDDRRGRAPI